MNLVSNYLSVTLSKGHSSWAAGTSSATDLGQRRWQIEEDRKGTLLCDQCHASLGVAIKMGRKTLRKHRF
jgi:hypothetical protein